MCRNVTAYAANFPLQRKRCSVAFWQQFALSGRKEVVDLAAFSTLLFFQRRMWSYCTAVIYIWQVLMRPPLDVLLLILYPEMHHTWIYSCINICFSLSRYRSNVNTRCIRCNVQYNCILIFRSLTAQNWRNFAISMFQHKLRSNCGSLVIFLCVLLSQAGPEREWMLAGNHKNRWQRNSHCKTWLQQRQRALQASSRHVWRLRVALVLTDAISYQHVLKQLYSLLKMYRWLYFLATEIRIVMKQLF